MNLFICYNFYTMNVPWRFKVLLNQMLNDLLFECLIEMKHTSNKCRYICFSICINSGNVTTSFDLPMYAKNILTAGSAFGNKFEQSQYNKAVAMRKDKFRC